MNRRREKFRDHYEEIRQVNEPREEFKDHSRSGNQHSSRKTIRSSRSMDRERRISKRSGKFDIHFDDRNKSRSPVRRGRSPRFEREQKSKREYDRSEIRRSSPRVKHDDEFPQYAPDYALSHRNDFDDNHYIYENTVSSAEKYHSKYERPSSEHIDPHTGLPQPRSSVIHRDEYFENEDRYHSSEFVERGGNYRDFDHKHANEGAGRDQIGFEERLSKLEYHRSDFDHPSSQNEVSQLYDENKRFIQPDIIRDNPIPVSQVASTFDKSTIIIDNGRNRSSERKYDKYHMSSETHSYSNFSKNQRGESPTWNQTVPPQELQPTYFADAYDVSSRNTHVLPSGGSSGQRNVFQSSLTFQDAEPKYHIQDFDPDTATISARQWLFSINDIAKELDWSFEKKKYVMESKLRGYARQWYDQLDEKCKGKWYDIIKNFTKTFPGPDEFYNQLCALIKRKKEENESMSSYLLDKNALLNACEITGVKAVSCVIGGLPYGKLKTAAKAKCFRQPELLYEFLREESKFLCSGVQLRKQLDTKTIETTPRRRRNVTANSDRDLRRSSIDPY